MSKYFETVNFWMENLLDSVGNYTIESNEKGKYVDIVINVAQEDMGKIIGRNGRVITSLRTLVSSIANLINNAIKYGADGKRIDIKISVEKKIVKIEVKEL